jgi:NADH-quinone oxidoreductase subunit J
VDAFRTTWINLHGVVQGSSRATGESLFRHWVLPFEALSVLLLAALVGAIVLSRRDPVTPAGVTPGAPAAGSAPADGPAAGKERS